MKDLTPWVLLAGAILANATANVLVKVAARHLGGAATWNLAQMAHNGWLLGGIASFAGALLLYTAALRHFPLTVAYPLMTGVGFVLVTLAAVVFLHEGYPWTRALGTAAILVGVVLLTR